jgi:hypothetical protein
VKATNHPLRIILAALPMLCLAAPGCRPPNAPKGRVLPPAYTSNKITDPALLKVAQDIKTWGLHEAGAGRKSLYSRVEVLPPVPIVQPYGVGVFQQEVRLPVVFTTGPDWASLNRAEKEAAVAQVFNHISGLLQPLDHEPKLRPTLTVQTPEGMELTWMNHLAPNGKNVHGND